jgi:hypothetical protein
MAATPDDDAKDQMTVSMPDATDLVTRSRLLAFAAREAPAEGLWLEFGVYKGKSLRRIAALTRQTVFGFDSFEGLPQDWVLKYRKGDFSLDGRLPADMPGNVRLVKGEFSESLPPFLSRHPGPVAFVHIDCDLYQSTRTVLTHLQNRIAAGTVILFDEFHNFPGWQAHEYRAFMEFISRSGCSFDYIGFASDYISVAVRIGAA